MWLSNLLQGRNEKSKFEELFDHPNTLCCLVASERLMIVEASRVFVPFSGRAEVRRSVAGQR